MRGIEDGIEGFFITPSGKKYESLKPEDIVFLSLTEEKDFLSWFNSGKNPSSEWRFHQDIYKNKWEAKAIVHAHSPHASAVMAPRINQRLAGNLELENGFSPDTIRLLKDKGHNVKKSMTMGSVQAIFIKDKVIYGVADTRRPGALAKGN